MLNESLPRRISEGALLVFAVAACAAPVAVLPTISPILATFGADVPWPTRFLLSSGPFFAGQTALAGALLLLWIAERLGRDAGLAARLRRSIPARVRERRVLSLAAVFGFLCFELLFCFWGAIAPQFQGSLAQ